MVEMQLAPSAFGPFYGATFSLLVGSEVFDFVEDLLPANATIFVLHTDGVIEHQDGATGKNGLHKEAVKTKSPSPLSGAAIGLKAVIVGDGRSDEASALVSYYREQETADVPSVFKVQAQGGGIFIRTGAALVNMLTLRRFKATSKANVAAFLQDVLAGSLQSGQEALGAQQQQLAALRQRYERLWLNHEKALRMIRGVGFGLRNICFSLEPGTNTIGGDDEFSQRGYRQRLPSDMVGLAAIHIYIARPAPEGAEGSLTVSLRRCADKKLVADHRLSYSDISEGWTIFEFPALISDTYGDGYLDVSWLGSEGPQLALADVAADRYGDDDGRTLALRLEKGLENQFHDSDVDGSTVLEQEVSGGELSGLEPMSEALILAGQAQSWQIRSHCMADFLKEFQFYLGAAKLAQVSEEIGFSPMSVSDAIGALQTHPYDGKLSAALLKGGVPVGATRLSCEVATAHVSAPAFTYVLIVLPSGTVEPSALIEKIVEQVKSGETTGAGSEPGIQWQAKTLNAQDTEVLAMDLRAAPSQSLDVVFGAFSAGGGDSYGWCRWYTYAVNVQASEAVRHTMVRANLKPSAGR